MDLSINEKEAWVSQCFSKLNSTQHVLCVGLFAIKAIYIPFLHRRAHKFQYVVYS